MIRAVYGLSLECGDVEAECGERMVGKCVVRTSRVAGAGCVKKEEEPNHSLYQDKSYAVSFESDKSNTNGKTSHLTQAHSQSSLSNPH